MSGQLRQYHRRRAQMLVHLGGKCVVCGSVDELEIYHKNPKIKSFNIGAKYSLKWETLITELNKCELRCKVHHLQMHASSHGTLHFYQRKKCRCDKCVFVYRQKCKEYMRKHRLKKRNNNPLA